MKDYYISVLYHPSKENMVAAALSKLLIGSVAYVDDQKKGSVRDVHRLTQLVVQFVDSTTSWCLGSQ